MNSAGAVPRRDLNPFHDFMIDILPISSPADLELAFAIRRQVFVDEQNVAAEEEYDEFETSSTHFLARLDAIPCGTARWRRTPNGVKLERFAVLKAHRNKGVAKALVQAVLNDVFSQQPVRRSGTGQFNTAESIEQIYLHAQLTAMPLYTGFGFVPVGPLFEEAGIQHQKMTLPGRSRSGMLVVRQSDHGAPADAVDAPDSSCPVQ